MCVYMFLSQVQSLYSVFCHLFVLQVSVPERSPARERQKGSYGKLQRRFAVKHLCRGNRALMGYQEQLL